MNWRRVDWIWHVSGSLALAPGQSGDDAFDRLDPLFNEPGTSYQRTSDTLTFRKKDQPAQDKMSVFDDGVLRIEQGAAGAVLNYRLDSRILLFCFLAPLLFLAAAQVTIFVAKYEKASAEASGKSAKEAAAKKKAEQKKALPQNPIDKALGAPAPEKPKKKGAGKSDEDDKLPKPTAAYVFAAIFAALYAIGRILEDRLVKRLFRRHLLGT